MVTVGVIGSVVERRLAAGRLRPGGRDLGVAATLMANVAQGWSHSLVGAVVAAWPAVSLVGSYELLVWLIRTSGTAEHRRPGGYLGHGVARRVTARSATVAATGAGFPLRGERGTPDQERLPGARVAGPPTIPALTFITGPRSARA